MSISHRTTLACDLCPAAVSWESSVSKTLARQAAKGRYGWRVDKLNRDVCQLHPRMNQRKTKET
jgi:hypothetical protein